jgi:hypothetical protein
MAVGFGRRRMFRRDDICHGPKISLKRRSRHFRAFGRLLSQATPEENLMSDPLKVLIICRHNSGRSQIAEAFF